MLRLYLIFLRIEIYTTALQKLHNLKSVSDGRSKCNAVEKGMKYFPLS